MSVPALALIIEDEAQLRRLLRLALESRGYRVAEAANGILGLQEAAMRQPDVILLDLGLPDLDGLVVLDRLREWTQTPVLILSVRDQEEVKIAALEHGADDFVTKPFSTAEVIARLAAIQRRRPSVDPSECTVGPLHLDWSTHAVTIAGEPLKLTPTEYALLKSLARHAGKIVLRRQLLREVWGPHSEEQAQYLRVYANHLRKKLDGSGIEIQNEPGVGYRLVGPPQSASG